MDRYTTSAKYYEFQSIYMEDDAPKCNELVKISSIERVSINTSGEDTDNTGSYYVWLTLSCGDMIACYAGTKQECEEHRDDILKPLLVGILMEDNVIANSILVRDITLRTAQLQNENR